MKRLLIVLCLMTMSVLTVAPAAHASVTLTKPERTLLALINHARAKRSLHRLRMVTTLERASRAHSREMLRRGYFGHNSYNGESVGARLIRFGYKTSGCTSWTVGECIAYGRGTYGSPKRVFAAWMKSPAHRVIILTKAFRNAGIGRAKGTYRGTSGTIFFTLDCGRRIK